MAQRTATVARTPAQTDPETARALLELLGEADASREYQPGVRCTALGTVLRRRDGAAVPATYGTLDDLAILRARGHVAEVEARVFRITAAGRAALRAADG